MWHGKGDTDFWTQSNKEYPSYLLGTYNTSTITHMLFDANPTDVSITTLLWGSGHSEKDLPRITQQVDWSSALWTGLPCSQAYMLIALHMLVSSEPCQELGACEEGAKFLLFYCHIYGSSVFPYCMTFERLVDNFILYGGQMKLREKEEQWRKDIKCVSFLN